MATYLERIAAEKPEDLIAAEIPGVLDALRRRRPTFCNVHTTYERARENRQWIEAQIEILRGVWRKARSGDQTWREDLIAFNTEHANAVLACKRFTLIAERSPRP